MTTINSQKVNKSKIRLGGKQHTHYKRKKETGEEFLQTENIQP